MVDQISAHHYSNILMNPELRLIAYKGQDRGACARTTDKGLQKEKDTV